jgi:hypothetical protein
MQTGVHSDGLVVQLNEFSREKVVFGFVLVLIDFDLRVKVRRFDPSLPVLAAVVELLALVAKVRADIAVEIIGQFLDVLLPGTPHEGTGRVAYVVRHMVVLSEA